MTGCACVGIGDGDGIIVCYGAVLPSQETQVGQETEPDVDAMTRIKAQLANSRVQSKGTTLAIISSCAPQTERS